MGRDQLVRDEALDYVAAPAMEPAEKEAYAAAIERGQDIRGACLELMVPMATVLRECERDRFFRNRLDRAWLARNREAPEQEESEAPPTVPAAFTFRLQRAREDVEKDAGDHPTEITLLRLLLEVALDIRENTATPPLRFNVPSVFPPAGIPGTNTPGTPDFTW